MSTDVLFRTIQSALDNGTKSDRSIVVAMCGIAGSGKSTLAKAIIATYPSFSRLSMDEIVAEKHGLFGLDYARDDKIYEQYLYEADETLQSRYDELLKNGRNIVLDRSFWAKEDRDAHKIKADHHQATWLLVYLKGGRDLLWRRINERSSKDRDANSA